MYRWLGSRQHSNCYSDNLPELSPIRKALLIHPFLNCGKHPSDASTVVYSSIGTGTCKAGRDARPGIAIVLRNCGDQLLSFTIGIGYVLPFAWAEMCSAEEVFPSLQDRV